MLNRQLAAARLQPPGLPPSTRPSSPRRPAPSRGGDGALRTLTGLARSRRALRRSCRKAPAEAWRRKADRPPTRAGCRPYGLTPAGRPVLTRPVASAILTAPPETKGSDDA